MKLDNIQYNIKCISVIELITVIRSYGPFVHEPTTSIHIAQNIDKATKSYHYLDSKLNFTNKTSASFPFMINNRATKSDRRSVLQIIAIIHQSNVYNIHVY